MKSMKLQVYDPPMCCSTGLCGPNVKPELVNFANDLKWLEQQGVTVERFNLASTPAAFMSQEAVKTALHDEGNECLPLIVVNGSIVSKGAYPSRSQLMKFAGIENEKGIDGKANATQTEGTAACGPECSCNSSEIKTEPEPSCGPGCCCNSSPSSSSKKLKTVLCIIVLLAVVGVFIYKNNTPKNNSNNQTAQNSPAFAVATVGPNVKTEATPVTVVAAVADPQTIAEKSDNQAAQNSPAVAAASAKPAVKSDVLPVMTAAASIPSDKAETAAVATVAESQTIAKKSDESSRTIGVYLDSLSSLNKVALSQDAVFIFIPASKNEVADEATSKAINAVQQTLKAKNINLGLYTLPTSSADYAAIAARVQAPAILIASKGKGMAAVSGEVTETKLLQAYIASARSGGCGPSSGSCGPSSGGCN